MPIFSTNLARAWRLVMLIWILFGAWTSWGGSGGFATTFGLLGGNLLLFVLISLLGWHAFGAPIH